MVNPDGFIMSQDGFIVLTQVNESCAFVGPGQGIIGIQPDGLVIGLNGFVVFALSIESKGFAGPGTGIVRIQPDGLIETPMCPGRDSHATNG